MLFVREEEVAWVSGGGVGEAGGVAGAKREVEEEEEEGESAEVEGKSIEKGKGDSG